MSDLKFALRQLLKNPGFTAVAVLTLALGIGANTVVFSVAKAVLFRPLGFADADRLMWLQLAHAQTGAVENRLSWREMEDLREATQSFEAIATFGSGDVTWRNGDQWERISGLNATPNLTEVLRVRPVLGRLFVESDAVESAAPVILISHELWQERFGSNPEVIGRSLELEGISRTIVGVLPEGLRFPLERAPSLGTGGELQAGVQSFWIPMGPPRGPDLTSRNSRMYLPVARMKPGITVETARAELSAVGQRLAADFPETNRHWTFTLESFRNQVLGRMRQGIPLLAVAVAAVLLICCVNLANLLLARGLVRQRELAVRAALGAGRRRMLSALMLESLALAVPGGLLGVLGAHGTLQVLRGLAAGSVPFIQEASLGGPAWAFTGVLALLTAGLFGGLPALWFSRIDPMESLRGGTRLTADPRMRRWQQGLLASQIAVVLVLLTSAALLLESFRRLLAQDLGYQPRSVVTLNLATWGFDTNGDVSRMYRALRDRLAALPGVEAVGTVSSVPLTGKWTFDEKAQRAGEFVPEADRPSLAATFVAFDYFPAMGIPLMEGRLFRDSELKDDGYGQIVVVNQTAATLLFPGRSAVGGRFTVGSNPDRVLEVIGVVKDTRDVRLEASPQPRFYWQYPFGGAQVVVRSNVPATALIPLLRDTVRQTDSRVLIKDAQEMAAIVSGTVAERRFLMATLSAYAAIALGMAIVGIFGVVAYQVAQRTDEYGIRLALGASPAGLMRLVLTQALGVIGVGLLAGLVLSLVAGRLLAGQLFELSPHNPWLLSGVSLLTLGAAALASALPARRASLVDPMVALRSE